MGSVNDVSGIRGSPYKLSDAQIRAINGNAEFDVMYDQEGFHPGYSSGNYEYGILKNYVGYFRWDKKTGNHLFSNGVELRLHRSSDNALVLNFVFIRSDFVRLLSVASD